MPGFRPLTVVSLSYLALFGAAFGSWLRAQAALSVLGSVFCAMPFVLGVLVLSTHRAEPEQYLAKLVACFIMPPILLLFWGIDHADGAPVRALAADASPTAASVVAAAPTSALDSAALFEGALQAGPPTVIGQGALSSVQSGVWSDGTELRLMRFSSAQAATSYLGTLSQTLSGKPTRLGARTGVELATSSDGALFSYAEALGVDVLQITTKDRASASARLRTLPPSAAPVAVAPAVTPAATDAAQEQLTERRVWPAALGFFLGHFLLFVSFLVWAAPVSTRVAAQPGVPAAEANELRARLGSLADAALGCELMPPVQVGEIVLSFTGAGAARSHVFYLELDSTRRAVFVREQERAAGAAPRDAAEADMRPIGSVGIDPTRPAAQRVYSVVSSATFIDPTRLAALDVQLDGPRASLPTPEPHDHAAKHVAYALAAVITRSGYDYQPILFRFQRA